MLRHKESISIFGAVIIAIVMLIIIGHGMLSTYNANRIGAKHDVYINGDKKVSCVSVFTDGDAYHFQNCKSH